jgi:hypothetical protein
MRSQILKRPRLILRASLGAALMRWRGNPGAANDSIAGPAPPRGKSCNAMRDLERNPPTPAARIAANGTGRKMKLLARPAPGILAHGCGTAIGGRNGGRFEGGVSDRICGASRGGGDRRYRDARDRTPTAHGPEVEGIVHVVLASRCRPECGWNFVARSPARKGT